MYWKCFFSLELTRGESVLKNSNFIEKQTKTECIDLKGFENETYFDRFVSVFNICQFLLYWFAPWIYVCVCVAVFIAVSQSCGSMNLALETKTIIGVTLHKIREYVCIYMNEWMAQLIAKRAKNQQYFAAHKRMRIALGTEHTLNLLFIYLQIRTLITLN